MTPEQKDKLAAILIVLVIVGFFIVASTLVTIL